MAANTNVSEPTDSAAGRLVLCPNITSLPGRWGIDEFGGETLAIGGTLRRMELGVWQFLAKGPTCKAQECYPVMVLTRSLDRIPN